MSSAYLDAHHWWEYPAPEQFATGFDANIDPQSNQNQNQTQNQTGWLLGNTIEGLAPPASWAGLASRPHVEEYVPPNPPQALGVTDRRMLVWPTPLTQGTGAKIVAQDIDEKSDLMQLPFFRRQVLKHNEMVGKQGKQEPDRNLIAEHSGVTPTLGRMNANSPNTGSGWPLIEAVTSFTNSDRSKQHHLRKSLQTTQNQTEGVRQHDKANRPQIHIQNTQSSKFTTVDCRPHLRKSLFSSLPKLTRPSDPLQLQFTLKAMKPIIVHIKYACDQGCRSRGICVHFSFVLGGRSTPDGLICDRCISEGVEKAAETDRECARHVDGHVYLAEDVLATQTQMEQAREVMRRAVECEWEGISGKVGMREGVTTATLGNRWSSALPVRTIGGQDSGCRNGGVGSWMGNERPHAKKARLDGQHSRSKQNNLANVGQNDFSQYLTDLETDFRFDNDVLSPDFTAFMANPDGGFGG